MVPAIIVLTYGVYAITASHADDDELPTTLNVDDSYNDEEVRYIRSRTNTRRTRSVNDILVVIDDNSSERRRSIDLKIGAPPHRSTQSLYEKRPQSMRSSVDSIVTINSQSCTQSHTTSHDGTSPTSTQE